MKGLATVKRALRTLATTGDVTRVDSGWLISEFDEEAGGTTAA